MKKSTIFLKLIRATSISLLLTVGLFQVTGQSKSIKKVSGDLLPTTTVTGRAALKSSAIQKLDLTLKSQDKTMTLIEAISDGNTEQLLNDLKLLGIKDAVVFGKKINGYIPASSISKLESIKNLVYVDPVYKPMLNSGLAYTNGDVALKSDVIRSKRGLDGSGIKIGVMSDSYNSLAGASLGVINDELPGTENPNGYISDVQVLEDIEDGTDEGRAMCEIIHDIAPASQLAFNTAYMGTAGFAQGILNLAAAGCNIITDDVNYLTEPFFQDGIIAQAVDEVVKKNGVSYYSSAGNYDRDSYSSEFRNGGTRTVVNPYGEYILGEYAMHDFDPGPGVDLFQKIIFAPGDDLRLAFQWDDPFASVCQDCPGAKSDLDIFLSLSESTDDVILESANFNIDGDAVEILSASNTGDDSIVAYVSFGRWLDAPGANPDPKLVKYINYGSAVPAEYITNSPTTRGHANTKNGVSVGASAWFYTPEFGTTPPEINYFSSVGGVPILFDTKGNKLKKPEIRMNPLFTATDGGNTSFFGFQLNDGDTLPNFFGTSASAPHAAAISAQLRQMAAGRVKPKTIDEILAHTAIDMDDPFTPKFDKGYDSKTGFGLIQADKAAAELLKRVGIIKPAVFAECSVDPKTARNWRINNPNPFNVEINWEIVGSKQKGLLVLLPGENFLETKTNHKNNLLAIKYENPIGGPVKIFTNSTGSICSEFKSAITASNNLNDNPNLVLGVYPNPFNSTVNLDLFNSTENVYLVKIYTIQGALVHNELISPSEGYSTTTLDLSELTNGIYFIKVVTSDGAVDNTFKLLKQ